ncbi:hypothetical protein AVEN_208590-1 [Araneus ventricosus]|uniref:Uncharacterized protein n=1 Tax=Araneus ventricosus TaxID=182803 RepID=A0A4Y2GM43_ARAVE|nr:hypothetical protein AVEN_208590-1 [Araneus ventricosus]
MGEDLQKFSGSRVMRTIAIGRLPIRNLPKINLDTVKSVSDVGPCAFTPVQTPTGRPCPPYDIMSRSTQLGLGVNLVIRSQFKIPIHFRNSSRVSSKWIINIPKLNYIIVIQSLYTFLEYPVFQKTR